MIRHIVFDLGGVLVDWNPRYLYRKIFRSEEEMEYFLSHVCHMDWNEEQDAGRSFADAIDLKTAQFPEYKDEIRAYFDRWIEMLNGPIPESVELLEKIHHSGTYNLYAITNWSAETFPYARKLYPFLSIFQDIVISGVEKIKKPDQAIYQLLLDRQQIKAEECIFIDDNTRNVEAAQRIGMEAIHFTDANTTKLTLSKNYNISV